jgi:hypothetical protein
MSQQMRQNLPAKHVLCRTHKGKGRRTAVAPEALQRVIFTTVVYIVGRRCGEKFNSDPKLV